MSYDVDCELSELSVTELEEAIDIINEVCEERTSPLTDKINELNYQLDALNEEVDEIETASEWWVYDIQEELKLR